jgi:hypothetical protein
MALFDMADPLKAFQQAMQFLVPGGMVTGTTTVSDAKLAGECRGRLARASGFRWSGSRLQRCAPST